MKSHGIMRDEDDDDDENRFTGEADRPMSNLRANPSNRPRSGPACKNCGKEFESWKFFLEHGKCSPDEAESPVSSSPASYAGAGAGGSWWKRKRSFRAKLGSLTVSSAPSEEEDLANCLMMLSDAAAVDPTEPEESSTSASKDELDPRRSNHFNNMISPISFRVPENNNNNNKGKDISISNKGLFECKACKKVFNSHQALGGHRASHKKVKGCFAARLDSLAAISGPDAPTAANNPIPTLPSEIHGGSSGASAPAKRKSKVHECSICHRTFSSGQALGGHKRCHWITSNSAAAAPVDSSALARFQQFQESIEQMNLAAASRRAIHATPVAAAADLDLKLDLNLPAESSLSTEIYLEPWNIGSSISAL